MTTKTGGAPSQPLEMGRVSVEAKAVEDYLQAVGDELPIYRKTGFAPPLYGTAASLGLLLKTLDLPPGAIHSLQELDTLTPLVMGQELRAVASVERPRQRAGLRFITASCALETAAGATSLTGKSTVMVAEANDAPEERENRQRASEAAGFMGDLPCVSRTITQDRLTAYAAASGDDNPLHLDADFAAGTRFGAIIAHGMLTLAFISEMMTAHLGEPWLTSGSLRVRFKGAAYLGDTVQTWGRAAKPGAAKSGAAKSGAAKSGAAKSGNEALSFNVGVINPSTGEDLIAGTASVRKNS